jgi:hypothetical protein
VGFPQKRAEKENWARLFDGDIHIMDEAYHGPRGAAEVAHEYGASEMFKEFGGRENVPDIINSPKKQLTHYLDDAGGFNDRKNPIGSIWDD